MQMNKKALFLFLSLIFGAFILELKAFDSAVAASVPIARKCELKTSSNHNNRNRLLNEINNSVQVLNYRTVKTLHFVTGLLFILGGLVVCHTCLKYNLHISNPAYARLTKLMLFPHHVFW